ncbi:MATE efflux family protein 9 [Apostasia shenzhenica]|uniref:MATE efflux family protein 9 n=1 Tax=Apostasia shenzhenica TaxID=1088818 RepID=A0A2I0B6S5_9ASPA|nr:MATE efflux family protein 9 [Apostasia shenzhenica]
MSPSPLSSPLLESLSTSTDAPSSSSSFRKCCSLSSCCSSSRFPRLGSELLAEAKRLLGLAAPLIAVNLFQYLLQLISLMFAGHLGELELSGASLATSFANVTGFSLLLGLGSALDTLCGQAYGAKEYNMLGIHMQRAMLVLCLASVPVAFIWVYTSQLLTALGQSPEISREAGVYNRGLIPGLFSYGLLQCHISSCLGSLGAALATSISSWMTVFLLAIYVNFSKRCKETWTGLSTDAVYGVLSFLGLAVPSALMICLNTMWMVYMIPTGLGSAVSIRVSNELGAGNSSTAHLSIRAVFLIVVIEGLTVAITTILVRDYLGYLFSNEEEVVRYVSAMMPVLATSNFFDGIQCSLSGTLAGNNMCPHHSSASARYHESVYRLGC